jgi:FkbM family methyltransferase
MIVIKNSISFNVNPCDIIKFNDDWFGGSKIFWEILSSGGWEQETFNIFDNFLLKDYSYLDIGAWVGPTVLYGAQLAKKCYAFEADFVAYELLKSNMLANPNISNIEIFSDAIAGYTGQIQFGTNTNSGDSMSSVLWTKESNMVNCISLEDFITNNNINDCNFIKMDIEGGEFYALPAAKDILQKIRPTLCLSLHTPWFSDKKLFLETIVDSISFYNKIYLSSGKSLNNKDVLDSSIFMTIIATDKG